MHAGSASSSTSSSSTSGRSQLTSQTDEADTVVGDDGQKSKGKLREYSTPHSRIETAPLTDTDDESDDFSSEIYCHDNENMQEHAGRVVRRTLGSSVQAEVTQVVPVHITFRSLSFSVKVRTSKNPFAAGQQKLLLKDLHGHLRPGEVTAIMGPSGAGKTTLLNVLSGRVQRGKTLGELHINGLTHKKLGRTKFTQLCAYIMQDDVMHAFLNPRETLWFSAQLRLPLRDRNKSNKVQALVEELGLESCQKTLVGSVEHRGISGGQRKRVSIGMEMITEPSVLFMDEPTSGLDSSTAYILVETLQKLADMGRTIVSTIHQPSTDIFFMFDRLILLSEGHIVYDGPTKDVVPYFARLGYKCNKHTNPAEFVMNLVKADSYISSKEEGEARVQKLISAYRRDKGLPEWQEDSPDIIKNLSLSQIQKPQDSVVDVENQKSPISAIPTELGERQDIENANGPNFLYRLFVLTLRCFLLAARNPLMVQARLAQTLFLAFLVGFLYLQVGDDQKSIQDRKGALYFIVINQAMGGMMSTLLLFPVERTVFIREHAMGSYSTLTYYLARLLAETPFLTIFPIIFCCISYWMVGLQADAGKFFIYVAAIIVVANVAQALGMAISAGTTLQLSMAISPMIFIPLLLLGGFFLENVPPWVVWAKYFSMYRYGYQVIVHNEMEGLKFTCQPNKSCVPTGEQALREMGFTSDEDSLWAGFLFLFMEYFLYHTLAYFLLRITAGRKKG